MRYERLHKLLDAIGALHDSKGADYDGGEGVEYKNHRAVEQWGIDAWKSPMLRIAEKLSRVQTFARGSTLQQEGVEDSLQDIAVLALIALVLFKEKHGPPR